MRILYVVVVVMCLACKSRPSTEPSPAKPVATAPTTATAVPNAAPPAAAATTPAGSDSGMCCCVSPDSKDGDVFVENCAKQKGKCVMPWTQQCTDDYEQQRIADERNEANEACPSKDRHDCDGDGYRESEDKDDNNPKVH